SQNSARFFLRRYAVGSGLRAQFANNLVIQTSNKNLRHIWMIALLSPSANRIERRVGPRPLGRGWAPPWRAVAPDLQNFRAEFAVADAGADFHLRPNDCGRADDFAAIVH